MNSTLVEFSSYCIYSTSFQNATLCNLNFRFFVIVMCQSAFLFRFSKVIKKTMRPLVLFLNKSQNLINFFTNANANFALNMLKILNDFNFFCVYF